MPTRWPTAPFEPGKPYCSGGRTEECVVDCELDGIEFYSGTLGTQLYTSFTSTCKLGEERVPFCQ